MSHAGKLIHAREFGLVENQLRQLDGGAKVLEVGCGTGRFLVSLNDGSRNLVGIDGSPEMILEVRSKASHDEHVEGLVAEAAKLPFATAAFDCCYSVRLLNQTESVVYALSVIREMVRVTRPGGLVLIEFMNQYRPRLGRTRRRTVRLQPKVVTSLLESLGAKVCSIDGLFVLGMTSYKRSPGAFLPLVDKTDQLLSKLVPRLASRVYLTARAADPG